VLGAQVNYEMGTARVGLEGRSSATDRVYLLDREGRNVYASPSAARAFGRRPEELVGLSWRDLGFSNEVLARFEEDREHVFRTGEAVVSTIGFPSPFGPRGSQCMLAPVRGGDGAIGAVVATVTDSTEPLDASWASEEPRPPARAIHGLVNSSFAGAPVGAALVDPSGSVLEANELWLRLAGSDRRALEAGQLRVTEPRILDALHGSGVCRPVELGSEPEGARRRLVWGIRIEGCEGLVLLQALDLGLLAEGREATRLLSEARTRLDRMERLSGEVVFRCRLQPEPGLEYASAASARVLGYSAEELIGAPALAWSLVHPEDRHVLESFAGSDFGGALTIRMRHKDGRLLWAALTLVQHYEDGELRFVEGALRDVTSQRRAEHALREGEQRKDEFLAMLSHELRNPLAPIRNSVYVLDRAAPGSDQARRAKAVIERQLQHLTRLLDALLDASRMSRGRFQLQREPLSLTELARRAAEDYGPVFESRGLFFEVRLPHEPLRLQGDKERLSQAVGELLHNAAKFTPTPGRVFLSLERSSDGRRAVLKVRDTGMGIEPELLERLFEPFSQHDRSLDRALGGLGLGLNLARGIVRFHRGTLTASSPGPGGGAELTLTLPLPQDEEGDASGERPAGKQGKRVLIIEDNRDSAESLREAVEFGDHRVAIAHDGREGLLLAREFRPEVVLSDIGLPGMDGYEVARAFRADPELRSVFLIALTGYSRPEDRRRAEQAGFDRHLAKPPDLDLLDELLAQGAPSRQGQG